MLGTFVFEVSTLVLVFAAVALLRVLAWGSTAPLGWVVLFGVSGASVVALCLGAFGSYSREIIYSRQRVTSRLAAGFLLAAPAILGVCWAFSFVDVVFTLTPKFFGILYLGVLAVVVAERAMVFKLFDPLHSFGNILILGTDPSVARTIREARKRYGAKFRVVGVLSPDARVGEHFEGVPVAGSIEDLPAVCKSHEIDTVLIGLPYYDPRLSVDAIFDCRVHGALVLDIGSFYEAICQKVLLERVDPRAVLSPYYYPVGRVRWWIKEAIERVVAGIGVGVAAAPVVVAAVWIRVSTRGSAFVRDERVGKNGRTIVLRRLRTYRETANGEARPTRFGRVLRRGRFDSLPLLISVVKGDLALVGPSAERPEFASELRERVPLYDQRDVVKPGLVGWSQLRFPYAASVDDAREKLRHDLFYVKNMSLVLDLQILTASLGSVVTGRTFVSRW